MVEDVGLMIVPTGIGANIGGYAGDASLYAKNLSEKIKLIVNPNIVNAAVFSGITDDMFYVEGWFIEQFVKGNVGLVPSKNNKIGIIFDKAIPENVFNIHLNTINAIKTVYGIDIVRYEVTDEEAGVEFFNTAKGISSGTVKNPETLEKAGRKLLEKGVQAIAVVCFFPEPPEDNYEDGEGVDIVGGVEAVISHYLCQKLFCPCVHAPAFEDVIISSQKVHPKVSSEYITPTFLPCLMFGLKNAPMIIDLKKNPDAKCISVKNLKFTAVPFDALGSSVVLDSVRQNIPVYAVKENYTVLNVDKKALNLQDRIIEVETYDELNGMI